MFRAEAERLGLTQVDVGAVLGIDSSQVSRMMSGRLDPSSSNLRAIVRSLDPAHGVGARLALAAARDLLEGVGIPAAEVVVDQREKEPPDEWWSRLPQTRRDRYRALETASVVNDEFDQLVGDLVPLALRLLAALEDSRALEQARRAQVYPFAQPAASAAAEAPPTTTP
jgi:transcriptional regulator with XRE-family HTH domain